MATVTIPEALQPKTLLRRTVERNPNLIESAFRLHRDGKVPPNAWILDLDAIAGNAELLAAEADRCGLTTYVMTKQHTRNPFVTHVALKRGLYKGVAVDIQCARAFERFDVPIGHVGHLSQVPWRETKDIVRLRPEVMTVYTISCAERISEAAKSLGLTQDLLVRPIAEGDVFFPGQEGGFPEEEIEGAVSEIQRLPNVNVVGVTSFPCLRYNFGELESSSPEANPNLRTITRVAERLSANVGLDIKQVNAPGNTSVETMALLADAGATHVEPGHGLLGTTPNHILGDGRPEAPAYVYVTEVSHHYKGRAYAFAGGLWSLIAGFLNPVDAPALPTQALVGRDLESSSVLTYEPIDQIIDYHVPLIGGDHARVGDTVVMAFYSQLQMTRSYTAPVSGVGSGDPVVHGLFDMGTNMVDENYSPVAPEYVNSAIRDVLTKY